MCIRKIIVGFLFKKFKYFLYYFNHINIKEPGYYIFTYLKCCYNAKLDISN